MNRIDEWDQQPTVVQFMVTLTVYREARGEPTLAQRMVAETIGNRARIGGWWGNTLWKVMTMAGQFSSLTAIGNRQTIVYPRAVTDPAWVAAWNAASDGITNVALAESFERLPTHYHDTSISPPSWTVGMRELDRVGRMIFYSLDK